MLGLLRHRSSCTAVAFGIAMMVGARAEAQRTSSVRGPRFAPLAVVRDYDGPGHTPMVAIRAPLDIVRTYDEADRTAPPRTASMGAMLPLVPAPWDDPNAPIIQVTAVPMFPAQSRPAVSMEALPRLPLLAFDGGVITGDASSSTLSVITDYDANPVEPQATTGRVAVTYDARGRVTRVETALPALPVTSSSSPSEARPARALLPAVRTPATRRPR